MHKSLFALALLMGSLLLAWPSAGAAQRGFADKPSGYVRFDTNLRDNLFWLGGAIPAGPVDLNADVIVEGRSVEADVGVAFYAGALAVLPMIGVSFDAADKRFDRLIIPRVFTVLEFGPLYFESWLQLTFRDPPKGGELNDFYTRDFLLYTVNKYFAFGPQVELRVALQDDPIPASRIISLPVGGQISTDIYDNRFALFVGYETRKFSRNDIGPVAWRVTYVRSW